MSDKVTHINSRGYHKLICQACGHDFHRKEATHGTKHRCPRCRKYEAVIEFDSVEYHDSFSCSNCGHGQFALQVEGLVCFKCGCNLSPLDVWTSCWAPKMEGKDGEDN